MRCYEDSLLTAKMVEGITRHGLPILTKVIFLVRGPGSLDDLYAGAVS